jgi:nitrite reductase/ring-hydroxylating ferredoxin subunit
MFLIDKLENAGSLDRIVEPVQQVVRRLKPGRIRDALHGVWLGHPLHPALVQIPAGTWISASFLDLWPGNAVASRRLVTAGLAAAVPSALAGWTDWSELHEQQMRVGLVHAAANGAAVTLYAVSLAAPERAAKVLRVSGLAAMSAGGMLGGHLAYRQSAGSNQAEPVPHLTQPGWHDLLPAAGLADQTPVKWMLGDVALVVVRDGEDFHVLAEKCSHLSGPLSGSDYSDGCLECPWHGSVFRVSDGAVVHGPATAPQPVFQTRVTDGMLQVCLPGAG